MSEVERILIKLSKSRKYESPALYFVKMYRDPKKLWQAEVKRNGLYEERIRCAGDTPEDALIKLEKEIYEAEVKK